MPGFHRGRPPKHTGLRFPADPPTVEEIVAVMRATGGGRDGARLRALIVVLWRAGLRISEALELAESDLDRGRGAVSVRRGKGGRRREVGMGRWAWEQLGPWLEIRATLPVGALFCMLRGRTAGRRWESSAARNNRGEPQNWPASASGSRRTSCGTRTRLRWTKRNRELPQRVRAGADRGGRPVVSPRSAAAFSRADGRRRSATKCLVKNAAMSSYVGRSRFRRLLHVSFPRRLPMDNLGDMMLAALMTGQSTVWVG